MKLSQLAVQFYTLRDHCKTAADFAASARKVRALGYTAAELAGLGPIPEDEIGRILAGEGLTLCSAHAAPDKILHEPTWVIDHLQKLGCNYVAYPYPHGIDLTSLQAVTEFARKLDSAGAQLRAAGITLSYHNHAHEFFRVEGAAVLAHLYRLTSPAHLQAELDTYWVQAGGGDPVAWCDQLTGRLPVLHLKDFCVGPDFKGTLCEVGRGNLDWQRILHAARRAGCQWYVVEQDVCPGDPFESLKISYDFLAPLAVE